MDDVTFNYAMNHIANMLERIALALESIERRT
jgi:hypothetical protein